METNHFFDVAIASPNLVEELYQKYLIDSDSVDTAWARFFEQLEPVKREVAPEVIKPDLCNLSKLIEAYRALGFLAVHVNPLEEKPQEDFPGLKLQKFGFSASDLEKNFPSFGALQGEALPLSKIIEHLRRCYTGRIGFELPTSLPDEARAWALKKIENPEELFFFPLEKKQGVLEALLKAELFESFLHTKFPGQKRFSLEGAETLIPMLAKLIEKGALEGVEEVCLGMAHRGRLNVLANILEKSYEDVFAEFEEGDFPDSFEGTGDVKYHKGFLSDLQTVHGKKIKISLTPNASHLESSDAIIEGLVRARQTILKDEKREKVIPILVHGDAAIAGQGVVYETLQMYRLDGYTTGGTIHIILNNQVGFTATPREGRSTLFCTDIAKAFGFPIFHLNAEDPESCVIATELALAIRQKFHLDVFLELNCYRKWGHNESDEPAFTQPKECKTIKLKKSIRQIYTETLIAGGVLERFMAEGLEESFKKVLHTAKSVHLAKKNLRQNGKSNRLEKIETAVSLKQLRSVAEKYTNLPSDFKPHPKLATLLKSRLSMILQEKSLIDWGMGEILAYGTLLQEGISLRLAGQDSGRGTFSHRHALFVDQDKGSLHNPFQQLHPDVFVEIINSFLSEYAALGFEYGFSLGAKQALVIWEAQFGDFSNGAQIIIDQYITAAEQKWGQQSSLTLLLPHGYEGQGPEHSSARVERFLSLAAKNNMYICNPSLPSQLFHLLRTQAKREQKKPLICFTPKSLLRHPLCQSALKEFETGSFQEVIDDPEGKESAKRVCFCTGKVYYDLLEFRRKEAIGDMCILRIEQLYPLNIELLQQILKKYSQAEQFYFFQEEPENMGAWSYINEMLASHLPKKLKYVGRERSASPATGSHALHNQESAALFTALKRAKSEIKIDIAPFQPA